MLLQRRNKFSLLSRPFIHMIYVFSHHFRTDLVAHLLHELVLPHFILFEPVSTIFLHHIRYQVLRLLFVKDRHLSDYRLSGLANISAFV